MTDARACQRSPVAMSSASMSVRWARNSRMSRYIAQSLFPYLVSTMRLTASRWDFLASQIATNCTSRSGSIHRKSSEPRLPTPMPPSTMRSLGGTAPFRPNAEAGMMQGTATALVASAARLRNCRRVKGAMPGAEVVVQIVPTSGGAFCCDMGRAYHCQFPERKSFRALFASPRDSAGNRQGAWAHDRRDTDQRARGEPRASQMIARRSSGYPKGTRRVSGGYPVGMQRSVPVRQGELTRQFWIFTALLPAVDCGG